MLPADFGRIATYTVPAACALGGLAAGLLVRRLVLPILARAAARSTWKYDDVIVDAIRAPVVLWFLLLGLRLAIRLLPFAPDTDQAIGVVVLALGIISVTWAIARFVVGAMARATGGLPGVSLIANVARVLIFTVGLLVVLQMLGIAITPMITALGVGGLAIGLALQDTLSNFFAGLRILAAGKIGVGNFIRLESGQEGWVQDISWGQTTLRQPTNSLVIVPNAKLSSAIVTNFSLPEAGENFLVPVGVAYGSDLPRVERVTLEVAAALQKESSCGVPDFTPVLRFNGLADSAVTFVVVLRAKAYTDRGELQHEFIKRLSARYASEGIEIPFPQRVVHLHPAPGG